MDNSTKENSDAFFKNVYVKRKNGHAGGNDRWQLYPKWCSSPFILSSTDQLTIFDELSVLIEFSSFQIIRAHVRMLSLSLWGRYCYAPSPGEEMKAKSDLPGSPSEWQSVLFCLILSGFIYLSIYLRQWLPLQAKPWIPHLCIQPLTPSSPLLPRYRNMERVKVAHTNNANKAQTSDKVGGGLRSGEDSIGLERAQKV